MKSEVMYQWVIEIVSDLTGEVTSETLETYSGHIEDLTKYINTAFGKEYRLHEILQIYKLQKMRIM